MLHMKPVLITITELSSAFQQLLRRLSHRPYEYADIKITTVVIEAAVGTRRALFRTPNLSI
jgi:hypothetical protein